MPLDFQPTPNPFPEVINGTSGTVRGEDYEAPEDAFVFRARTTYRPATLFASVALRRLFYLEEAIARGGNEQLADVLFGIRCAHIRAMLSVFNGDEPDPPRRCAEFHFETQRRQVTCRPDDE